MQIIIPMSGFGERFRRAGYTVPKPLIEIDGKPIIAHVIDMFPGELDFIFICNQDHLNNPDYRMEEILRQYCPTGRVVGIPAHKLGPIHAVRQVEHLIDPDRPVVVNYCDFTCYWDYAHFRRFVQETKCDGAIPAYRLSEGDLWRHSVAAALACEVIAQKARVEVPPDSFTASLLHDIGKLTLSRFLDPDHLRRLAAAREQGGESSLQAESEILGMHHGELGGVIASHWNLPPRVVRGITYHHTPTEGDDVICDVTHVANVLAKRAGAGHVSAPADLDAEPDALDRLGLSAGRLSTILDTVTHRLAQAVEQFG